MKLKRVLAFALVLCMALACVACGNQGGESSTASTASGSASGTEPDASNPIKIGLIAGLTGAAPMDGLRMQQGTQMAIDEWNANGGVLGRKIELLTEDDQTLQDMAVTCATKLMGEGVVGIIGPHRSTNAIAVNETIKNGTTPTFVGGTTPQISTLGNEYLFRARASDSIFAEVAAKYCVDTFKAKKVGISFCNDEYGTGGRDVAKAYLEKNGVEVIDEGHNVNDKDFTSQLTKFKNAGCDTLIFWMHDTELSIHTRQVKDLGMDVNVMSSPGLTMSQVLDMCDEANIEGYYAVSDFVTTSTDPDVVSYKEKFESKYNEPAELYGSTYYGATNALLTAIEKAGTDDRAAVKDALRELEGLHSPNGIMNVDENNDMIHSVSVAKIEKKKPVFVELVSVE